jgi:hypothetical protein
MLLWLTHPEGDRHAMMEDVERLAGQELVPSLLGIELDTQWSAAISKAERQPGKWRKQRGERQGHPGDRAGHQNRRPRRARCQPARQGAGPSSVDSQIMQISERCLAEVVVRQLEVTDFGGNDRLNGRRGDESRTVMAS